MDEGLRAPLGATTDTSAADGSATGNDVGTESANASVVEPSDEESAPITEDDATAEASTPEPSISKPLKSILKKRKQESVSKDPSEVEVAQPVAKIPKGGSIANALKMLSSFSKVSDSEVDDSDPKPSAFILEMERQKALSNVDPGTTILPAGYSPAAPSTSDLEPNPVDTFKNQEEIKAATLKEVIMPRGAKKRRSAKSARENTQIESIVYINNLPYKATKNEILSILGICPKGGKDGIRIITDSSALPAGYAYVIIEWYYDLMDTLRLTGLDWRGRKLSFTRSTKENLMRDWRITKRALSELDKSRVICVKKLSFTLKKHELMKALHEVKFSERDIYWKPLLPRQTNSGRGFVILSSHEDAKKLHGRSFPCVGRKIEVTHVHPDDMMKFLRQCRMNLNGHEVLIDELPADADDISDLKLDDTAETDSLVIIEECGGKHKSSPKVTSKKDKKPQNNKNWNRPPPPPSSHPSNFMPTVFVRLFNVPEKATTLDIRSFFEPVLPAKIAQNIGYNIWDVEFYNPNDAMQAMRKQNLMMRKNVIQLEMLPGPPQPLPPNQLEMLTGPPQPLPPNQFPVPVPHFIPPGVPMMIPPPGPGMMGPPVMDMNPRPPIMDLGLRPPGMDISLQSGFPGMMIPPPPGGGMQMTTPPTMFDPSNIPPVNMQTFPPSTMPLPVPPMASPPVKSYLDPKTMPPPMGARMDSDAKLPRHKKENILKPRSPVRVPPPKKELIPVPPIPEDFIKYEVPRYDGETPVGQAIIAPMQGYFCQLCNKFYSSRVSAKDTHCKTKAHYEKLKQMFQEKKRLRKLAESEHIAVG